MTARTRIFRHVRFADIVAYLDLGWHFDGDVMHAPHGQYAVTLEWLCNCPVAEPRRAE